MTISDRSDARSPAISRRGFVVGTAAAGLGLSFGFPTRGVAAVTAASVGMPVPGEVNAWVVIQPDDTVVIRIARSEMGQGTLTGLAQLVAEELECDWSRVTTEYPTPGANLVRDRVWQSFSTGGSRGIRDSHLYVRQGGAAARMMLIQAAADRLSVPQEELIARNGVISHAATGQSIRYGEVATDAAALEPPVDVPLKPASEWRLIGQPVARLDTAPKVDGSQVYGADLTMPGMLTASIRQCPVFGGTVASFDGASAEAMPGVHRVVQVGDNAVAVVADTWWQAHQALDQVDITWDNGPNIDVSSETISGMLDEGLEADDAFVGNEVGDVLSGLNAAAQVLEATYEYPFQNHATMEPMNATALWTEERCEVWCPTQNGEAALAAAADAAGLPIEQCDVHKLLLGGGFGRRGAFHDYVRQAVQIARQMPGVPVKLLWSREEDMMHGMYHPVTKARIRGGLDAEGNLTALHLRISGQSILTDVFPGALRADGADMLVFQGLDAEGDHAISYSVPNLLVDHAMRNQPVPPGFWRGVNVNQNAIYIECFMDELAHATGRDPLEFRLSLMEDHPKNAAVLRAVAERAGWGRPAEEGIHRGLSVCKAFGAYTAACAEVSVSEDGRDLTIHRIVAATDPIFCVNPQQTEAQVAGSFVYGLTAMKHGAITIDGGSVNETNFDTYPSLQLWEMPEVETIVMPSMDEDEPWGGVGEPTIAVAAPAVLNAIFAATGKRIRALPIGNQNLRET